MIIPATRVRPSELKGEASTFLGQYAMAVPTGAVTTVAAGTASAGHLLALRWTSSTSKLLLRRAAAQFVLTTAFGAAQEVGCELFCTRSYSAAHTAQTAIDVGGTNTDANKIRKGNATSLVSSARVAGTGALTDGTHTIDPNALGSCSGYAGAVGVIISKDPGCGLPSGVLWEARADQSPIVLTASEGLIIRNTVLMGASGVGRWQFFLEWDEVTL